MSKPVKIASSSQFEDILKSSKFVVADFYADWCAPCKQTAPIYDQLTASLSKSGVLTFTKVNVDEQAEIGAKYGVKMMPTFMVFRDANVTDKIEGADVKKLQAAVKTLHAEVHGGGSGGMASGKASGEASGSGGSSWLGADLPRGYKDVTDQIEVPRCELLNIDSEAGGVRVLFGGDKPGALSGGKKTEKDWVESDVDEQLMLFVPFQSMIKLHTLQITSIPSADENNDDDEAPMRPKNIKLYSNKPHNLDFDEAEGTAATQEFELSESDWNSNGTANIALRFVKFQNINSIVLFVMSGDGSSEKVRIDRIRFIGETGEKRDMGKLEKIGDETGE